MTVGYSAAGNCWATADEAVDAFYSAQNMTVHLVTTGTANLFYRHRPAKVSGVWYDVTESCSLGTFNNVLTCNTASKPALTNVIGVCTITESSSGGTVPSGLPVDFDYSILGALFAFSFSVVVGIWLFGRSAGSVVNIFKPK